MSDEIGFGIGTSKKKFFIRNPETFEEIWFYQDPLLLGEVEEFQRLIESDVTNEIVQNDSVEFFKNALTIRRVNRATIIDDKFIGFLGSQDLLGIGVLLSAGALALQTETKPDGSEEKK